MTEMKRVGSEMSAIGGWESLLVGPAPFFHSTLHM